MQTQLFGERIYIRVERGFDRVGHIVPDLRKDVGVGVCGGSGVEDVLADAGGVEGDD